MPPSHSGTWSAVLLLLVSTVFLASCAALEADPVALGEKAMREGRYEEAVVHFDAALAAAGPNADVEAKLDEALFRAGEAAMARADYVTAKGYLERVSYSHPKTYDAQDMFRLALHPGLIQILSLKWSRPVEGIASFVLSGRPEIGVATLTIIGEGDDGSAVAALSFATAAGQRFEFPWSLYIDPFSRDDFPVHVLADGRILIMGLTVWRPPAEPEPLCLWLDGGLQGWAIDPFEEHVAATLLVDGPEGKTLDTIVADLATGEYVVIDSYTPGPVCPPGWVGNLVALGWDERTLHYERYAGDTVEFADWTLPDD